MAVWGSNYHSRVYLSKLRYLTQVSQVHEGFMQDFLLRREMLIHLTEPVDVHIGAPVRVL